MIQEAKNPLPESQLIFEAENWATKLKNSRVHKLKGEPLVLQAPNSHENHFSWFFMAVGSLEKLWFSL